MCKQRKFNNSSASHGFTEQCFPYLKYVFVICNYKKPNDRIYGYSIPMTQQLLVMVVWNCFESFIRIWKWFFVLLLKIEMKWKAEIFAVKVHFPHVSSEIAQNIPLAWNKLWVGEGEGVGLLWICGMALVLEMKNSDWNRICNRFFLIQREHH